MKICVFGAASKTIDEKLIPDSIARTKSVVRFVQGTQPDESGNVVVSYLSLSDAPFK